MYRILKNTPFGFIIEIVNDECYYSESDYDVCLNGIFFGSFSKNVISIFGLEANTEYEVKLSGEKITIEFQIKTKNLQYLIDVRDYNAAGDGCTDDTAAINAAIYTAPPSSVVYIPRGVYLVNQVFLKSSVDLYIETGACIRQNTNRGSLAVLKGYQKDYHHEKAVVNTSWEGNPLDTFCSVLYGKEAEDISIYGGGQIDGNGEAGGWWVNPKEKARAYRPKNISLVGCRNISICGLTSRNSASWNIHPFYCEDVKFYGITLESSADSPNTDGINPESSHNVEIIGCDFHVGDDCIAIKSGKYFLSRNYYRASRQITIRNCYLGDGHGGIAIGSETSSGVEQLSVRQCYFQGTDRGIRIKTRRGRGSRSVLEQISFSNLQMKQVGHCFAINMFYNCDPDGHSEYVKSKEEQARTEATPEIRNIEFSYVRAEEIKGCGIFMFGLPESKIQNIRIENNQLSFSPERIQQMPEMLDDFQPPERLGVFMKNTEKIVMAGNQLAGDYVSIIEDKT